MTSPRVNSPSVTAKSTSWESVKWTGSQLKPVLNWANVFFANLAGSIRRSYLVLNWANFSSRTYLEVFVEAIFGVQKASLNMFREHSPYWTIIASDWLRAELSCGRRNKKQKNKKKVLHSLRREFVYLLTCGRRNLVSETQNEIVVS